jgi:hypothetical protein
MWKGRSAVRSFEPCTDECMGRLYKLQSHTFTALVGVTIYTLFKYNRAIFTLIRFPISLSTGPCICDLRRKGMDYKTREMTRAIYTHISRSNKGEKTCIKMNAELPAYIDASKSTISPPRSCSPCPTAITR